MLGFSVTLKEEISSNLNSHTPSLNGERFTSALEIVSERGLEWNMFSQLNREREEITSGRNILACLATWEKIVGEILRSLMVDTPVDPITYLGYQLTCQTKYFKLRFNVA